MTFSYLVTQEKLESYSNSQSWMRKAKDDFYMRLTNKQFPCLFALNAFCNKGILFLFIDDKQSLLLNGLMEYISFVKNTPIKNRLTNPLVIFFKQKFDTLEKEHVFAWKQIQFLHDNDTQPYPSHIPLDTDSPQWCFCFQDIELFINVSCPHHDMYKNRNLGAYIAFVINPRENFDFVASGSKKKVALELESELEKGLKIIIMVVFQKSWDFLVMKIIENGGNIL